MHVLQPTGQREGRQYPLVERDPLGQVRQLLARGPLQVEQLEWQSEQLKLVLFTNWPLGQGHFESSAVSLCGQVRQLLARGP